MKSKTHLNILVFFSILIFSFLLYTPTLAQTPASTESLILKLQEQVKLLQSQIEELRSQVFSTKTELELVKTELKFTKALRLGTRGDEVTKLQEFLKQFPDIYPQGLVTGYFGPLTEAAVRKFQEKQGIDSIGVVGPRTLSKLNELVTEGAGSSDIIPPGLLIAPGIQSRLATTTVPTTPVVPATTTPIVATTTPAGITPATPATSATPATPTSVSGAPTVSATPATPATPAVAASTATTTTSTTITASNPNAPIISNRAIEVSSNGARITWTTNINADSLIYYSTVNAYYPYGSGAQYYTLATSHSVTLFNLTPNTSYLYKIQSNGGGSLSNSTITEGASFTTLLTDVAGGLDTTPPVISNLRVENITTSGAQIKWTTNEPATDQARWKIGSSASYLNIIEARCFSDTSQYVTDHCISFTGLSPNTLYYYKAQSQDSSKNTGVSNDQQFTTISLTTTGTLSFSKSSFSATYIQGTPIPSTPDSLTFTNTSNINVNYTISVPNKPAWLNSSYATQQLTATPGLETGLGAYLDPTTVATTPGTYTTNIIISGNFSDSPKTIPVTLTVIAANTSTATTTSSLNSRSQNLSAISQMINSLDEIIKQLSKILK